MENVLATCFYLPGQLIIALAIDLEDQITCNFLALLDKRKLSLVILEVEMVDFFIMVINLHK